MLPKKLPYSVALFVSAAATLAQAQVVPVSRTLRASASAGGNSDFPPNLVVANDYGTFSHSAFASGNGQTANGGSQSTINADSTMHFSTTSTGFYFGTGSPPFATTSQDNVFDLTAPTQFKEDISGVLPTSGPNGLSVHYTITEQSSGVVRSQTHTETSSFTNPSAFFTLQPGRYTLHLDSQSTAGGSAPGGGSFSLDLAPVPEPTSVSALRVAAGGLLARRRR